MYIIYIYNIIYNIYIYIYINIYIYLYYLLFYFELKIEMSTSSLHYRNRDIFEGLESKMVIVLVYFYEGK